MSIIAHLKDEYTGLKSTAFLSTEEINLLVRFLIDEGTRAVMENAFVVSTEKQPDPQEFVKLLDGEIDKNCLIFNPTMRRIWCDKGDMFTCRHDFVLDGERRRLLSGYKFGKYGEVYGKNGQPLYEDLELYIGERKIFESTSHEYYAAADLDGLEEKFNSYGNMPELTAEIIKKLNYATPPEFINGTTALVTLDSGNLTVETTDGCKVVFEFCGDDNEIAFNTGYLGGTPKYIDGKVVLTDANPCSFVSGKTYVINYFTFTADVQGVTKLKNGLPTFCELYIELISSDGKYCDIEISSPYINALIKTPNSCAF